MRRLWIHGVALSIQLFMLAPVAQAAGQPLQGDQPVDVSDRGERFARARQKGVPNRYIVILEDQFSAAARPSGAKGPSVSKVASEVARLHAATPLRTWEQALPGFLVELPEEAARALSRDPRVRFVEQDAYVERQNVAEDCVQQVTITDSAVFPTSPQMIECADPRPSGTGCFDNWGLDRIDQRLLAKRANGLSDRDGFYSFNLATAGVTVHAYLLDTGITAGHQEFRDAAGNSRIGTGVNASVPLLDPLRGDVADCTTNGHGTHVAGILGGMTYGVSKDVRLHPVKIGCGTGMTIANIVEGINWILANRPAGQPAVANLSFNSPEFPPSLAAALAVTNLIQSGVTLVQSAGNQNQSAADVTMTTRTGGPLFPQEIIIAGGMDERDFRWTRSTNDPSYSTYCPPDCGSNYGDAVDIWAPASHIVSSSRRANNALCWLSGTSMAAPHVAGTAALLLGRFPNASPSAVQKAIQNYGTPGAVTDSQSPPSATLLYSRFPATGGPVAGDDRFFISPGVSRTIMFTQLLAGDFDWDGDSLSIVSFVPPTSSQGQIQVYSDRVRYIPNPGFSGEATFSYRVTDGRGNYDTALVRMRVESPWLPPVAVNDNLNAVRDQPLTVSFSTLTANDYSRNNNRSVNFKEIVGNPQHGTLGRSLTNDLTYTPYSGFTGTDSFVYRIQEQETLLTADATVFVNVTAPASRAYLPIGWVDGYNGQWVWGWACDPDYPTESNRVDIYSTAGQFLGSAEANQPSSAPINNACGGGSAHYFSFYHNGGIAPGTHFVVWSIDRPYSPPGNNQRIAGTGGIGSDGTEFVMPWVHVYAPTGWVDGYDGQHVWGWACDQDYPTQSNRVDVYTTSWQYLGSADANGWSSAPINNACGGGSAHYFDFYHWGAISSGTHFMVWSIDLPYGTPDGVNRPIGGNGSIGDGTEFVMP